LTSVGTGVAAVFVLCQSTDIYNGSYIKIF